MKVANITASTENVARASDLSKNILMLEWQRVAKKVPGTPTIRRMRARARSRRGKREVNGVVWRCRGGFEGDG